MGNFRLVKPEKKHEKQAMDYLKEFYASGSETHGVGGLERHQDDYDGWLKKLEADRHQVPNDERVPAETFFLMERMPRASHMLQDETERLIGIINIRLVLNDALMHYGGNIGYGIRPSERQKGYAKLQLFLALNYCQHRGIEAVLLDCDKNNLGSAKTMIALGGKLLREYQHQVAPGEYITVQQYVIDVDYAISHYGAKYRDFVAEYPTD